MEIKNYTPPQSGFAISLLKAELELVAKGKIRPGSAIELDSLELSSHIISRYTDQVYSFASIHFLRSLQKQKICPLKSC